MDDTIEKTVQDPMTLRKRKRNEKLNFSMAVDNSSVKQLERLIDSAFTK